MSWIYISLIAFGFLPFLILLYKIKKTNHIKETGIKTMATVKNMPFNSFRRLNRVEIEYPVRETGQLIRKSILVAGLLYQQGDKIPICYKKENPAKMILDTGKTNTVGMVFTLIIAAFVIAACILISQGISSGEL